MELGYFKAAWGDIKNSPGWFGKVALLGLLCLVPVFGVIVLYGYAYGWAREIAWNIRMPLPERILNNGDNDSFYTRGVFAFVIALVCNLLPSFIDACLSVTVTVLAALFGVAGSSLAVFAVASALFNGLVSLAVFLFGLVLVAIKWVGIMRMSIYGRLSAGFQVRRLWAMIRHDSNGILRIFGMYLLLSIAGAVAIVLVGAVLVVAFALPSIGSLISSASSGDEVASSVFSGLGFFSRVMLVLVVCALVFAASAYEAFVELMVARAMGYWTARFDVAAWRGQDDPMPFEAGAYIPTSPGGSGW